MLNLGFFLRFFVNRALGLVRSPSPAFVPKQNNYGWEAQVIFTGPMPFLPPTISIMALKGTPSNGSKQRNITHWPYPFSSHHWARYRRELFPLHRLSNNSTLHKRQHQTQLAAVFHAENLGKSALERTKPFWILMKQEMMEWQWHQLDHICTSLDRQPRPRRHLITQLFVDQMLFLTPK